MTSYFKAISSLCLAFCCFFLFSCQADLISSPNVELITGSSSSSNGTLSAPVNLTASHGGYRSVTLTWKSTGGAARYNIYSADSAFSEMVQIGETKDSSSTYTVSESSGVKKYYSVAAVDYDQKVSALSSKVFGSTLAIPFITEITNGEDGSTSTVKWWMSNCDSHTYLNSVRYEVFCYGEDKTTQVGESITVSGETNSVTFTGLSGKTTYYYKVAAYHNNYPQDSKTEFSDLLDSETAHRLVPNAPVDFRAEQGTNKDYIELSWVLPDFVDYKSGASAYDRHPIYFALERKELSALEDDYEVIAAYIGSYIEKNETSIAGSSYVFYANTVTSNTDVITVIPSDNKEAEVSQTYTEYVPGAKIFYKDNLNLERGKQYEYRIRSFVDDSKSVISSDTAVSTAKGWLIGKIKLNTSVSYTAASENKEDEGYNTFTKTTVSFTSTFDSFGLDSSYQFILTRTYTPKNNESSEDPVEQTIRQGSLETIKSYKDEIECNEDTEGYYRYTLYVVPIGETSTEKAYDKVSASGQVTVTKNRSDLKSVKYFTVKDGFKDKFVLKWDYDATLKYRVSYKTSFDDFTEEHNLEEFTDDELDPVKEGEAYYIYYNCEATSGENRTFTITSDGGIEYSKTFLEDENDENSDPKVCQTLGTPKVVFEEESAEYDTITVTWEKVQKAKTGENDFSISAHYAGNSTELVTDENCSIKFENDLYTATITKPEGFDNALKSGLPISLSVFAKSEYAPNGDEPENEYNNEISGATVETRTLGPALINTEIKEEGADYIQLSWNKVPGATGYAVYRMVYSKTNTDASTELEGESGDLIFCSTENDSNSVTVDGNAVEESKITVIGNTYTFTDSYSEKTDDTIARYYDHQAKIPWGLPYSYIVLPVKDSEDFKFDGKTLQAESKVEYKDIQKATGATYGYGLSLRARKAESATVQTIEWTAPYHKETKPTLYRRIADSTENHWERVEKNIPSNEIQINYEPDKKTEAYEYVVAYNKNVPSGIELPPSFLSKNSGVNLAVEETNYDYGSHKKEKLNKGYLLATNFTANYGGTLQSDGTYAKDDKYYSEFATWDEWDYNTRSIGPTNAYISVKNYNISASWTKLATLDSNLSYAGAENVTNTNVTNSGTAAIYVKPATLASAESVTNGTMMNTVGPLMVLRDAKHYYSLTLERGAVSVMLGGDDSVYAYRQINDVELVRHVNLLLAGIIDQTGINDGYGTGKDFGKEDQVEGTSGTFQWGSDSGSNLKWQLNNFTYYFSETSGGKGMNSFIKIEDTNSGKANRGAKQSGTLKHISVCSENKIWKVLEYPDFTITGLIPITVTSIEIPLESYNGTVGIAAKKDKLSATVSHNGSQTFSSGTIEGSDKVKRWCPIDLDGNDYNGTSSTYGWWPEE